jgi:outer membrane protein assembly factor BamB
MAIALVGGGPLACSQVHKIAASGKSITKQNQASEKVFSVEWWFRADETFVKPYRPIQSAKPETNSQNNHVYVATNDGFVRAFDSKGNIVWEYNAESEFVAGPTYENGKLWVADVEGKMLCLNAADGKKLWEYRAGEQLITKPVIAEDLILVFSSGETLYAVEKNSGKWRWQYKREQPSAFGIQGSASPLVLGKNVYQGFSDGYAVSILVKDGTVEWERDLGGGKEYADVDAGPVIDEEGNLLWASYATGVFSLRPSSGETVWMVPKYGVTRLVAAPESRRFYVGGSEFVCALSSANGAMQWQMKLPKDQFVSGLQLVRRLVLVSTGTGPLLFLDAQDGGLHQQFDPGQGVWAEPKISSGNALVVSNRGYLYNLYIEKRGDF